MKYYTFLKTVIISAILSVSLTACIEDKPAPIQERNVQAQKAKDAANSISFAENAEIANIKARLELTANPGLLGYIVLLNETGQPVITQG